MEARSFWARNLRNIVNNSRSISERSLGPRVLTVDGAAGSDTSTASDKLIFRAFAAPAKFERALVSECTGGRPCRMGPAKVRLVMAAMGQPETEFGALCAEFGTTCRTLYRHVSPAGVLRPDRDKSPAEP